MGVGVIKPCIYCTTVYNIMYTVHHKIKTLRYCKAQSGKLACWTIGRKDGKEYKPMRWYDIFCFVLFVLWLLCRPLYLFMLVVLWLLCLLYSFTLD